MGYPDSQDRELYCELLREGQPYIGYHVQVVYVSSTNASPNSVNIRSAPVVLTVRED